MRLGNTVFWLPRQSIRQCLQNSPHQGDTRAAWIHIQRLQFGFNHRDFLPIPFFASPSKGFEAIVSFPSQLPSLLPSWVGLGWGWLRAVDQRPALRYFPWPPTISLRTSTSHQEEWFQEKYPSTVTCVQASSHRPEWPLQYFSIKSTRDEVPLTTIFSLIQYLH